MRASDRRLALLALLAAGCGSVPDLVFVDPLDAGANLDEATDAASIDGASTDAAADARADASVPDATTCPSAVPEFATACCGSVPCYGPDCSTSCAECMKCPSLQLCCPSTPGKVVCKPNLRCN